MQNASLWRGVLGIEKTAVEDVEFDDEQDLAGLADHDSS